eukprot:TRINITY_DN29591_c0_g1_i2.p1 TRINITY_DN29591_c0_g1~~TRINITY_DN29591_c0_g1_i2.p1  ORF type:complete len:515 (+),score=105.39 TRINITY_DN29591_c0_g1_i2:76-1620(+)
MAQLVVLLLTAMPLLADAGFSSSIPKPEVVEEVIHNFAKTPPRRKSFSLRDLPKESSEVMQGIVQGFLGHDEMQPNEVHCLSTGAKALATDVMTVSEHLVMLMQKMIGDRKDVPGLERRFTDPVEVSNARYVPQAGNYVERRLSSPGMLMTASGIVLEFGYSLQKVAALSHQIMDSCVKGDALVASVLAMHRMTDIAYVGMHVVGNGADLCEDLMAGASLWEEGDRKGFGTKLGGVMRKVLLSNKKLETPKAKALPASRVLANITESFLATFFGPGMTFDLTLKPSDSGSPGVESLHLDLHKCIGENADFFEKVESSAKYMLADSVQSSRSAHSETPQVLAYVLAQLPELLDNCKLGAPQKEMLKDAFSGMQGLSKDKVAFNFNTGRPGVATEEAFFNRMSRTARHWQNLMAYPEDGGVKLGHDLGILAQDVARVVFPEKYSVDSLGRLRRRFDITKGLPASRSFSALSPLLLLLALALFLLRYHRRYPESDKARIEDCVANVERGETVAECVE